nr:hypothetical protein [Pandoravirus belohorizontensis]
MGLSGPWRLHSSRSSWRPLRTCAVGIALPSAMAIAGVVAVMSPILFRVLFLSLSLFVCASLYLGPPSSDSWRALPLFSPIRRLSFFSISPLVSPLGTGTFCSVAVPRTRTRSALGGRRPVAAGLLARLFFPHRGGAASFFPLVPACRAACRAACAPTAAGRATSFAPPFFFLAYRTAQGDAVRGKKRRDGRRPNAGTRRQRSTASKRESL